MGAKAFLAFSTFPDAETARRICRQLVEEKLAACANIFPAIESICRWKGKIETGQEMIAFFKTSVDRHVAFQEKLRALHPYELPEIIFVPIAAGLPGYPRWGDERCLC